MNVAIAFSFATLIAIPFIIQKLSKSKNPPQHGRMWYIGCYLYSPLNTFGLYYLIYRFSWGLPEWSDYRWQALVFVIVIVLYDLSFYCLHRLMHDIRWFFVVIHSVHHRAYNPCPLDGLIAHPLETLVVTAPLMFLCKLLGANIFVLWLILVIATIRACINHDEHKDPTHFVHHKDHRYNFGPNIWLWDKLGGTFRSKS